MMNQTEARRAFSLYYQDLKAQARRDGHKVDRKTEWVNFLKNYIEWGELPAEAANWSLK